MNKCFAAVEEHGHALKSFLELLVGYFQIREVRVSIFRWVYF